MRVRVTHTLNDLARDLERIPAKARKDVPKAVRAGVAEGKKVSRRLARERGGPHGERFYKRITSDINVAAWSGEWGPDGAPKTEFVGAGYRSGSNTDLDDAIEPAVAATRARLRQVMDGWFW